MCTLSYVPAGAGFILTSNRDEDPDREAAPPEVWSDHPAAAFQAPRDLVKQGTWIAKDGRGRFGCLLNGAFEVHPHQPPYRRSRGSLIPEAFQAVSFPDYCVGIDLKGIEPFTLVLIDEFIQVLIWDGSRRHLHFLSKKRPHLWSSASLYSREEHRKKSRRFSEFLHEHPIVDPEMLLELHGFKAPNNFVLNKPGVKTVSITQVEVKSEGGASMKYYNLPYELRTH